MALADLQLLQGAGGGIEGEVIDLAELVAPLGQRSFAVKGEFALAILLDGRAETVRATGRAERALILRYPQLPGEELFAQIRTLIQDTLSVRVGLRAAVLVCDIAVAPAGKATRREH